jgi:hypothetical protein
VNGNPKTRASLNGVRDDEIKDDETKDDETKDDEIKKDYTNPEIALSFRPVLIWNRLI